MQHVGQHRAPDRGLHLLGREHRQLRVAAGLDRLEILHVGHDDDATRANDGRERVQHAVVGRLEHAVRGHLEIDEVEFLDLVERAHRGDARGNRRRGVVAAGNQHPARHGTGKLVVSAFGDQVLGADLQLAAGPRLGLGNSAIPAALRHRARLDRPQDVDRVIKLAVRVQVARALAELVDAPLGGALLHRHRKPAVDRVDPAARLAAADVALPDRPGLEPIPARLRLFDVLHEVASARHHVHRALERRAVEIGRVDIVEEELRHIRQPSRFVVRLAAAGVQAEPERICRRHATDDRRSERARGILCRVVEYRGPARLGILRREHVAFEPRGPLRVRVVETLAHVSLERLARALQRREPAHQAIRGRHSLGHATRPARSCRTPARCRLPWRPGLRRPSARTRAGCACGLPRRRSLRPRPVRRSFPDRLPGQSEPAPVHCRRTLRTRRCGAARDWRW